MYSYMRLMLVLDFVIPISSTSLPGGNLVDGLPPAASLETCVSSVSSKNTSTAEIQIIMKNLQF